MKAGFGEFVAGLEGGARNMIGIGVATGAAGIIVGTISLTGAHQIIGQVIEVISGGNLIILLVLVAVLSLILGMGLPTTAELHRRVIPDGPGDRQRRRAVRPDVDR